VLILDSGLTPLASAVASVLTALTTALGPTPLPGPPAPAAPAVTDTPAVAVGAPLWTAPLDGPLLVVDPFDPPAHDWLPGHRGVDLLAFGGDAVRAAGPGVVVFAGPVGGRGVVTVLHDDGRRTTYEPVAPEVGIGDVVDGGQVIGRVHEGAGHCGELPSCLHWGLLRGEDYLDPMRLMRPGRPTLLPGAP
jgi:murein DD-endopeptidase MepM/ murein hydrolase activator NlpD